MTLEGKPHPHSFYRDGNDTRVINVVAREGEGITIKSGIKDLLVLKSTGSAFFGYDTKDAYTILPETHDRILSTSIECHWQWSLFKTLEDVKSSADSFDEAWSAARSITMDRFANENSPSVQNTMYKMCEDILAANARVDTVEYTLPNKHYFEISKLPPSSTFMATDSHCLDLSWHKDLKNTGKDAEVYAPQTDPNGLIHCVVSRKS